MPLERNACLLDDVWQALIRMGLQVEDPAPDQTGRITAVSIYEQQLRILLQMPAQECRDGGRALADLENALREIPGLSGIDLEIKPHPRWQSALSTTGGRPFAEHNACLGRTLTDQGGRGWVIDDVEIQPRGGAESQQRFEHAARVLVRAWITTTRDRAIDPGTSPDAA